MLFNSYIFILFFFPIAIILYYSLNRFGRYKLALGVMVLMSLCFYAYFHIWYLTILIGSIVVNWSMSRLIITKKSKCLLAVGIALNVAVIFVFKYFNFFLENINCLFKSSLPLFNILLPLGISFFTFQQISYLVDSYHEETKDYSFLEYALFVSFFPQLIAGPIVLHQEMIPQFRNNELKSFNHDKFAGGLHLFAIGLAKKVLLADSLAQGVDWGYSNIQSLGSLNALLVAIFYSFQLYFDFSGYCDMACGIAECFNLELPINFNSPYKAASIGDFWKRWHITLTRFLTRYIYIPLGGSRKGKTRTLINILLVFFISGLWHGANWTFILWGTLHGIAMVLYRLTGKCWDKMIKPVRVFLTYAFVTFAWIPFRADSVSDAIKLIGTVFTKPDLSLQSSFLAKFNLTELTYIENHIPVLKNVITNFPGTNMWIMLFIAVSIVFFTGNCHEKAFRTGKINALGTVVLLLWCTVSLAGMSTFLYFNF